MELQTAIKNRRSVRKYTTQPVSKADIDAMLAAACLAPSGGNRQPWHFYVIQNADVIQALCARAYTTQWFQTSPLVICVTVDPAISQKAYGERGGQLYAVQDSAAAIQNMLLTAHELGLGCCWCGAFDESEVGDILSLPEGRRPLALLTIGHPEGEAPAMPRKRPAESVSTFI